VLVGSGRVATRSALNAARMGELTESKRYAVAAALLFRQRANAFDDGAQMLIRQMGKIEHSADEALKTARTESAERIDGDRILGGPEVYYLGHPRKVGP
jgi:hypothetical protein